MAIAEEIAQTDRQRQDRKFNGAHYTPDNLATFVAEKIVGALSDPKKALTILDPAVGDGALLSALAQKVQNCERIIGYDLDPQAVEYAQSRVANVAGEITPEISCTNYLKHCLESLEPSLFQNCDPELVDAIIANPPYVRTQVLGADEAQRLAKIFGHTGRVDLYFAFLSCIARHLRPGGIAGVIVSNRFMSIKAGEKVREQLLQDFDILNVWDFGDTKLFEAAVLPAVLLLRRKEESNASASRGTEFVSIYSASDVEPDRESDSVFSALNSEGAVSVDGGVFSVRVGHLSTSGKTDGVWQLVDSKSEDWLRTVEANTFCRFGDIGKIRVGVKTTADKVFIKKNWGEELGENVPELLRPLVTHHEAGQFLPRPTEDSERQILYTHETKNGRKVAVDLDAYPKSRAYLNQPEIRERLESRGYVAKAGRKWFEIWVPQDPSAWEHPKLVFSDISESPTFWMEKGGRVVNGDCYWLLPKNSEEDSLILLALAVGNSRFIEKFYDFRFNNKLYAGRRRFMTQYVEEFPVPDPASEIGQEIIGKVREILKMEPESAEFRDAKSAIDVLVDQAFQV